MNYRRNLNSIWEIKDEKGKAAASFEEKETFGEKIFNNLFLDPPGCLIQEILKVVGKFPTFFTDEINLSLEEEVSKPELKAIFFSMRNGKSPSPNKVIVEFFKSFYDILKEDLLLMIRESQN